MQQQYIMIHYNDKKAELIIERRNKTDIVDNFLLKKRRKKFIDWLNEWNWNPQLKVLEMYPFNNERGAIYSKHQIPQYLHEYKYCNTRTKIPTETKLEIDKLPLDKSINLICQTCLSLIKSKIHFAVFYAQGQRSPYINIYDWDKLTKVNPYKRIKLQVLFWRKHVPFGCFHFVDTGLFDDEHLQPLEFAPHWKYGTPFNLLFEWKP